MSSLRTKTELSGFEDLAQSARKGETGVRPALLVALSDLFGSRANPSAEEIRTFEDMAMRLLPDADAAVRAHVAARLARHPCAPTAVLDALLRADRVCATVLLEHCPRLDPDTVRQIAESGSSEEAAILARRRDLEPWLAAILMQRDESEILAILVANSAVNLDETVLRALVRKARRSPALAAALCDRVKDPALLTPLFLHAGPQLREAILHEAENVTYSGDALRDLRTANPVLIDWLVERGRQGFWGLVAQEITRVSRIPRETVDDLLADERGEGLAILLSAIGVPVEKAVRLFLGCKPAISHSYERVRALEAIMQQLPAYAASNIAMQISGEAKADTAGRKRPVHVPLYDPTAASTPGRPRIGFSSYKAQPARQPSLEEKLRGSA